MSTVSQNPRSISSTQAFTDLVSAIDRSVSPDRAAELLADFRSEVFREAAEIAERQRQFKLAYGARKSAQVSENVGILRVATELRSRANGTGGQR